jgi:glycerate 2-kinase
MVAHRAAPTPAVAVVGRNDLTQPTPLFTDVYAVAEFAEIDTANDAERTASELQRIGGHIGYRYQDTETAAATGR